MHPPTRKKDKHILTTKGSHSAQLESQQLRCPSPQKTPESKGSDMATALEGNPDPPKKGPALHYPWGSWGQTLPGDRLGCHAQLLCPAPQALLARCWPASIGSCPLTPRRATVPGLWGPAQEEQGPLESSSWSLEGSYLGSFVSGGKTQTCHGSPGPTSVPVVDESTHSFTHSFIHSRAIS